VYAPTRSEAVCNPILKSKHEDLLSVCLDEQRATWAMQRDRALHFTSLQPQ